MSGRVTGRIAVCATFFQERHRPVYIISAVLPPVHPGSFAVRASIEQTGLSCAHWPPELAPGRGLGDLRGTFGLADRWSKIRAARGLPPHHNRCTLAVAQCKSPGLDPPGHALNGEQPAYWLPSRSCRPIASERDRVRMHHELKSAAGQGGEGSPSAHRAPELLAGGPL